MERSIAVVIALSVGCCVLHASNEIRQKRYFRPIEKVLVFKERVQLPKHNDDVVYYGPDGSLFPPIVDEPARDRPAKQRWPLIKFD